MNKLDTRWSSRISFIFATSAAAIGLGNIWRFPYLAGQNGGAIFVLVYLLCVLLLGIPLLIAEIAMGRVGRYNPSKTFRILAEYSKRSSHWQWVGGLTILSGYLILTYYIVISGWVVDYLFCALLGKFTHVTTKISLQAFKDLQNNPWRMLISDTLVIICAMATNTLGIKRGLERAVLFMFPALLLLLFLLLGYAMTTGDFKMGVYYLFYPDIRELSKQTILLALGQTFFSLSIAMGITMMYSAYLPEETSVPSAAIAVAIADTGFALLAGLIVFPVVFAYHLKPDAGPSLVFQTLPIAFGHIPYGNVIAALFFLMLFFAAFSSVIALIEPTITWLMETIHCSRIQAVFIASIVCWIMSLGAVGSFSAPKFFSLFGVTWFQAIDFLTASIMLPIGGIFIAIFCGWFLTKWVLHDELLWKITFWYHVWQIIMRYFAPLAILFILLSSLGLF